MTCAFGEARTWAQILGPYRTPDVSRSIFELLVTAVRVAVGVDVGGARRQLLALSLAGFADRLPSHAPIYDSARLRPWSLLQATRDE
jgi:hypothetical protein